MILPQEPSTVTIATSIKQEKYGVVSRLYSTSVKIPMNPRVTISGSLAQTFVPQLCVVSRAIIASRQLSYFNLSSNLNHDAGVILRIPNAQTCTFKLKTTLLAKQSQPPVILNESSPETLRRKSCVFSSAVNTAEMCQTASFDITNFM